MRRIRRAVWAGENKFPLRLASHEVVGRKCKCARARQANHLLLSLMLPLLLLLFGAGSCFKSNGTVARSGEWRPTKIQVPAGG